MAWTLISNASDLCQRMTRNRSPRANEASELSHDASDRLFLTVNLLHQTLALRHGRLQSIHEATKQTTRELRSKSLCRLLKLQAEVSRGLVEALKSTVSSDERLDLTNGFMKDLLALVKEQQSSFSASSSMS